MTHPTIYHLILAWLKSLSTRNTGAIFCQETGQVRTSSFSNEFFQVVPLQKWIFKSIFLWHGEMQIT
jgi:hypothetical protein